MLIIFISHVNVFLPIFYSILLCLLLLLIVIIHIPLIFSSFILNFFISSFNLYTLSSFSFSSSLNLYSILHLLLLFPSISILLSFILPPLFFLHQNPPLYLPLFLAIFLPVFYVTIVLHHCLWQFSFIIIHFLIPSNGSSVISLQLIYCLQSLHHIILFSHVCLENFFQYIIVWRNTFPKLLLCLTSYQWKKNEKKKHDSNTTPQIQINPRISTVGESSPTFSAWSKTRDTHTDKQQYTILHTYLGTDKKYIKKHIPNFTFTKASCHRGMIS